MQTKGRNGAQSVAEYCSSMGETLGLIPGTRNKNKTKQKQNKTKQKKQKENGVPTIKCTIRS